MNLKQVIVPDTVKKIDSGAFAFTSANKIIVETEEGLNTYYMASNSTKEKINVPE